MDTAEIQKIYSLYEVDALLVDAKQDIPNLDVLGFPAKIEPPSAFAECEQIISDVSYVK